MPCPTWSVGGAPCPLLGLHRTGHSSSLPALPGAPDLRGGPFPLPASPEPVRPGLGAAPFPPRPSGEGPQVGPAGRSRRQVLSLGIRTLRRRTPHSCPGPWDPVGPATPCLRPSPRGQSAIVPAKTQGFSDGLRVAGWADRPRMPAPSYNSFLPRDVEPLGAAAQRGGEGRNSRHFCWIRTLRTKTGRGSESPGRLAPTPTSGVTCPDWDLEVNIFSKLP